MGKDFILSSLQLHHLKFSTNISQFQHFLPSPSPLYPNPLTQSSVNIQFPYPPFPIPHTICRQYTITLLPSLPNPPNTICRQHTIPPFPLYPIRPTQSAVNTIPVTYRSVSLPSPISPPPRTQFAKPLNTLTTVLQTVPLAFKYHKNFKFIYKLFNLLTIPFHIDFHILL